MGIQFEIDHNLVRGLDYYSRTTFEILSSSLGAQAALCGGGRYDGLVEMIGGKSTPGIGFAAGIERILLASSHEFDEKNIEIYIVGFGENVRVKVVELAELLRENHISCDYDMLRRSMKAQLREANKMGASFAIIIGDNELEKNRVELKDLTSGEQVNISMDSIVSKLKSLSF